MISNREINLNNFINIYKKNQEFDVIIVGGGITGAGIALACSKNHLKTLLIEAKDFGYSSSGNSSKLVHGGLRYLQNGQFHVTFQSVREREKLLKELPKLIWPINFALPYHNFLEKIMYKIGLVVYDLFAGKTYHKHIPLNELLSWFPFIRKENLKGGYLYQDAQTDDVRLLIRTLKEAERNDAIILNYFSANDLIIENDLVRGVHAFDEVSKKDYYIKSKVVINASGFLADKFRTRLGLKKIMRPLRGSHIVLEDNKLPIKYALGFKHPDDKRNIFVLPWLGKTVVGTTDLDHNISDLITITEQETEYLLKGVNHQFPEAKITRNDIYSTWSGVRPVVSTDSRKPPSKESRDIFIEFYKNLLTVTGGKLTTFRLEAKKVLKILRQIFYIKTFDLKFDGISKESLNQYFSPNELDLIYKNIPDYERILIFYGKDSKEILKNILNDPEKIFEEGFYIYKAELDYCMNYEWVITWEDLFYRRFRFGIVKKEMEEKIKKYFQRGKNESLHT